ncbi:MAG: tRNA pseudouridine(38-40) synthase TruA [Breznakibacter sp.]
MAGRRTVLSGLAGTNGEGEGMALGETIFVSDLLYGFCAGLPVCPFCCFFAQKLAMARFKIILEYEGTRYAGWQVQQGERTVQGAFFDACRQLFDNRKFEFYGAGRTDGGVHALQQVAHLDVDTDLSPQRIRFGLNDRLPYDINVLGCEPAHPRFHARYDATARSYLYLISHRRTAFGKANVWWVKDNLDLAKMREAAKCLTGMKDFASFTDKDAETTSTKVEVMWVDVLDQGDLTGIHIVGSHFLWKMVRRMTGVMVEAGRGKLSPGQIESFFGKRSDIPAKLTAPASGLYLEQIYYRYDAPKRGMDVMPHILRLG